MGSPIYGGGNPYQNLELLRWLDSYEGVPEISDPSETARERAERAGWRSRGNEIFGVAGTTVPGVALAVALALAGEAVATWFGTRVLGFESSPVSGILIAILLGLAIRNTIGLPMVYDAGLRLCLRRLLRVGVALLGIRLSLTAAGAIGAVALPIVLACIAVALVTVIWASAVLRLPRRLTTLIAVGTAICGNTAIVAMAPIIHADDDEVSYAVACVTIFGLAALLSYPFLAHWLFAGDASLAGLFLGTAIHDTAQVAGAGLMYLQNFGDPTALDTATVTKLVRNLCMLVVIPLMAVLHGRSRRDARDATPFRQIVPLFVFGFVAMTVLRTVGDLGDRPFGLLPKETWEAFVSDTSRAATALLAVAMASVGLGTSFAKLRDLGFRPFALGMAAALLVGSASLLLIGAAAGLGIAGFLQPG